MKAIEIAYLLGSLRDPPDEPKEMRELLGCSRATAYRWLKFMREKRANDQFIAAAFSGWARHA